MRVSRTTLSCTPRAKVYETYRVGDAFDRDHRSPPTPPLPIDSAFPLTYILRLRSCRLMGAFIMTPLPSLVDEGVMCSRTPSLHGRYPASSLLRTQPPPSRLRPFSRALRLYSLPCSADFSAGRGRLLQLLGMPLSPCRSCYPAGAARRFSQIATYRSAFAHRQEARPPDFYFLTRLPLGSLALRPGDLLTIPKMAWSAGFTRFVSSTGAAQATGPLTFAPVGLTPTEHASLRWTHCLS